MKQCSKCKELKDKTDFYKDKSQSSGLETRCKECKKEYYYNHKQERKAYYEQNREIIKVRNAMNSDAKREYDKKYRVENRDVRHENAKIYNALHKKEKNLYRRNRRKNDMNYMMRSRLRGKLRLSYIPKKENITTTKLFGCSFSDIRKHLEKQFKKGMTWDNYGKKYGQWQLDHIIPCCAFDLTKESEQLECFNYTNLQPLWTHENELKGYKYEK